jgi:hypothetical protein
MTLTQHSDMVPDPIQADVSAESFEITLKPGRASSDHDETIDYQLSIPARRDSLEPTIKFIGISSERFDKYFCRRYRS